jgi:hypothetical protein
MKPWYSPQSRQFNELVRALKNAFAMLGVMFVAVIAAGWFSK